MFTRRHQDSETSQSWLIQSVGEISITLTMLTQDYKIIKQPSQNQR